MTYREIQPTSYWSAEESTYNTWVESATQIDGEHLSEYTICYKKAMAIGFNQNPTVYKRGSAIFSFTLRIRPLEYFRLCCSRRGSDEYASQYLSGWNLYYDCAGYKLDSKFLKVLREVYGLFEADASS